MHHKSQPIGCISPYRDATAAYALPSAGFALLFGRFADLFGRRRLFMASMVLTGASLLGGLASTPEALLAARALQGLATAMALPAALSLLTTTFAEGRARDRALGLNGALLSGGFTIGALVGGTLVSLLSWRAAFLINIPVTALILLATPFVITESRLPDRVKLDVPGAVTVSGGLLALVYAFVERSLVAGAVGVVLLAAFWVIELRSPAPLASVRILKRPNVKWGNFAAATLPLVFLEADRAAVAILIPALFIGFFGHVAAIVAYTVTGTSGLPDAEQGLATGLTTMTQQVAISVGIPILSAIAATQAVELTGIRLALGVNVVVTLATVAIVWIGLRPRYE